MSVHELKTWPQFFQAIVDGDKTFEVRKNDRGFQRGDLLILKEYPEPGKPDPFCKFRKLTVRVTYVLSGFGLSEGFVAMGIKAEAENED